MGESYRQLVEKEVKAEVKRAWAEYLYAWNLRAMYAEQRIWADRLQQAGELRYTQGESTLLERQMAATIAAEMRNKLFQAEEELKLAAKRLQWCCYAPEPICPRERETYPYPVAMDSAYLSVAHLNYFESQVKEKQAMLQIERSRFSRKSLLATADKTFFR